MNFLKPKRPRSQSASRSGTRSRSSSASGATSSTAPTASESGSVSPMRKASSLSEALKKEWKKSNRSLKKTGELLAELKVVMANLEFLPTIGVEASEKELKLARDILEIGVQWSVAKGDLASFERYMTQLKTYYNDYTFLPESPLQYQLLGLNLLFLLSQNRVADFHTEVELLPSEQILENPYLKHPLGLEQCLMEGSYNRILQAKANAPAKIYGFFVDMLLQTVRQEIGACMESAYDRVSLRNATRMLNLRSSRETMAFAEKRAWSLCPKDKHFHFQTPCDRKEPEPFPSSSMINFAVDYARELDMIV